MAKIVFSNNADSKLAGALTNVATSFSVTPGEGLKFPTPAAGEWFPLTLAKVVSGVVTYEIVKVTAKATDTFTVVRAQEGTTATTFSAGDAVSLRLTKAVLDSLAQKDDANVFTQPQTVPNATAAGHAVNKGQLDAAIAGGSVNTAVLHAALLSF